MVVIFRLSLSRSFMRSRRSDSASSALRGPGRWKPHAPFPTIKNWPTVPTGRSTWYAPKSGDAFFRIVTLPRMAPYDNSGPRKTRPPVCAPLVLSQRWICRAPFANADPQEPLRRRAAPDILTARQPLRWSKVAGYTASAIFSLEKIRTAVNVLKLRL